MVSLNQILVMMKRPSLEKPQPKAWAERCQKMIPCKAGITLIGHSLGCIEAISFLKQQERQQVNLILVVGFDKTL